VVHLAVVFLGVFGEAGVLLGEEVFVGGGLAVALREVGASLLELAELRDDGVLARFDWGSAPNCSKQP
jgi:hypothetical protein